MEGTHECPMLEPQANKEQARDQQKCEESSILDGFMLT